MSGLNDFREKFGIVSSQAKAKNEHPKTTSGKSSTRTLKQSSVSDPAVQYRLAAYVRLSPSDEIREEGSLVSHPQRIRSFVEFRNKQTPGWGEIVEWYTDKDMSGKDMNRPAFRRMLLDIQKGKVNAVVVTELSRLSRNVKDFCQFWDFLKNHRATFISLKENFDTSTPIGEMMVIQCISFAQFERKTIVTRIKDGARARAERGLANGSQRLIGYDPDPNKKCHLVINESEAETVRHVFNKFIEMGSIRKLMDYLNAGGFRTKRYTTRSGNTKGGNLWTPSSLHNVLSNLAYIAKREINKKNRTLSQNELAEVDRYRVVEASWPRLVSDEMFSEAQKLLIENCAFTRHKHVYRLTGLVKCGVCSEFLTGKGGTGRHGGKFYYYAHNRKFTTQGDARVKRCPLERIPAVHLEESVITRLLALAASREQLVDLAQRAKVQTGRTKEEIESLICEREQERRVVENQIDNLLTVLSDNPTDQPKSLLGKISHLESQKEQLAKTIHRLREEREREVGNVFDLQHVFRLFGQFQSGFANNPAHRQRNILRKVVHHIEVHPEGTKLFYFCNEPHPEVLGPDGNLSVSALSGASDDEVETQAGSFPDRGSPVVQIGGESGKWVLKLFTTSRKTCCEIFQQF